LNDFVNEIKIKYLKEIGGGGGRALGIIEKPWMSEIPGW
jgi:hypothetical protein